MYKLLPTEYGNMHRVKVRFKKNSDYVARYFDKAFEQESPHLRQRAIFTNPILPESTPGLEPYYIFPINNYRFLYSHEITNSNDDYREVVDTLFDTFYDSTKITDIVTDLLKFTYSTQYLYEGLIADAEIIFYGIPYYYAIKVSACPDYKQLIKLHKY
jgi:hypothetical protein